MLTMRVPQAATRVQAAFRGHLDRIRAQQVLRTRTTLMRIQRLQARCDGRSDNGKEAE